jgi:hypothetical protein
MSGHPATGALGVSRRHRDLTFSDGTLSIECSAAAGAIFIAIVLASILFGTRPSRRPRPNPPAQGSQ